MKTLRRPSVRIQRRNSEVVVSFEVAVIDERNFAIISDELDEVARTPVPQTVIIDLTGVYRVDELGLIVLQSLRDSIREVGGTAVFRGPTDQIERDRNDTRHAREISD